MKNIGTLLLFLLLNYSTFSQGVFLNLGKNFTSFSYKDKSEFSEKLDINGVGDAFELGYMDELKYKNFKGLKYTSSITINDYNGIAVSTINNLEYKTSYLGVQSTIDYQFYESFCFFLSVKAGLNLSTIIRGKQTINDDTYNLVGNREFTGLFIQPVLGIYAKYYISKNAYLSTGLNLGKGIKLGNNANDFSINNTQIQFGGYFDLIKK